MSKDKDKPQQKSLFSENAYGAAEPVQTQDASDFLAALDAPVTAQQGISSIATAYLAQREVVDAAKARQTEEQRKLERMEWELIQQLDAQGVKSIKLADDTLVTAAEKVTYKLPSEDNQAAVASVLSWLEANGGENLIRQTVAWQSFSGFVSEKVKNGETFPNIVRVEKRRVVSVRKS